MDGMDDMDRMDNMDGRGCEKGAPGFSFVRFGAFVHGLFS